MIISKTQAVQGGAWNTHLQKSVAVYNRHYNRGIGFSPEEAVVLSKEDQQQVKENNKNAYDTHKEGPTQESKFQIGDTVRAKLNKGKLDKNSTPSWTEQIYKITKIIPKRGASAEKYRIDRVGFEDKIFTRNDLQKVDTSELEKIPVKKEAIQTRRAMQKAAIDNRPQTRSITTNVQTQQQPPTLNRPKPKPKLKFKKGDKIIARYPEGEYQGVVQSSTKDKLKVFFQSDNSVDTFFSNEFNTLRKI